jgi:PIN domain nuclease of toxin-antitoxin system
MRRCFIDTCVLIWILEEQKRVNRIVYDMEYYQREFFISMESVSELVYLIQYGKLSAKFTIAKMLNDLKQLNLKILDFDYKSLEVLKNLPFFKQHPDPIDRKIIAHAIANNCILISSDSNFSLYEPYGLTYIEV